jgi:O-antigen ligase
LDIKELEKIACLAFLFGFGAPVLGIVIAGRPTLQQLAFALICVMIPGGLYRAEDWGLTLGSPQEFYRGHANGYHFYFVEGLAMGLIIARAVENWREFRLLPPGLWLYFVYCALSLVSIVNAPNANFALMAAFKAIKITLIFIAAYNFLTNQKNIQVFLLAIAAAIGIQLLATLRQRYLLGIYQVTGTFEHQNSLSMFVSMIGMVFLAVTLGPRMRWSNLYLVAYIACAFIQQSTFSRAGMVVFAAGSIAVAGLSLIDRFTLRRLAVLGVLGAIGVVGILMSLDTIAARFRDYGNMSSGKTRQMLNQAARDMVTDYPLGFGWNNFAIAINRPFPYGHIIDEWERGGGATIDPYHQKGIAESLYYLVLAETGWQGLLSLLLFMLLFLWWNVRAGLYYRYHPLGALSLGIAFGCGTNYIQSTLERVLVQPRNMMLWLVLLALAARIHTWRKADTTKPVNRALPEAPEDIPEPLRPPTTPVVQ